MVLLNKALKELYQKTGDFISPILDKAKKPFIGGLALLTLYTGVYGDSQINYESANSSDSTKYEWRLPSGDIKNTACTDLKGSPNKPSEKWKFEAESSLMGKLSSADIDNDGAQEILFGDSTGAIYCINGDDGLQKWKTYLPEKSKKNWIKWASPILIDINKDNDLEVIVGTGNSGLFALDCKGNILWQNNFGETLCHTADDIDNDGKIEVIVGDYKQPRRAHCLNAEDGSEKWDFITPGSMYNIPAIDDIDNDGKKEIILHTHREPARETLFCLNKEGKELWKYELNPSEEQLKKFDGKVMDYGYISPVIADFDSDGKKEIFTGTDLNVYLFDNKGGLIWKKPTGMFGSGKTIIHQKDGSAKTYVPPDYNAPHGFILESAVGDINGDGKLEAIIGLGADYDMCISPEGKAKLNILKKRNQTKVFDYKGDTLWAFNGRSRMNKLNAGSSVIEYPGNMGSPILADINGDGYKDILIGSTDGYIYALDANNKTKLWDYHIEEKRLLNKEIIFINLNSKNTKEIICQSGNKIYALEF